MKKTDRANWVQQENGDILPSDSSDGCRFSAGCYDRAQGRYIYPRVGKFCRSSLDSDSSWCCAYHERDYWRDKYEALQDMVEKLRQGHEQ